MFHSALVYQPTIFKNHLAVYIDKHPGHYGALFTSDQYECQLKRGCALLRPKSTESFYRLLESICCIDQASPSQHASQLAESLAKCKSESRAAEIYSILYHGDCSNTPLVSRDACKIFIFSGSSVEAQVYRQLVVERINDNDITTALKLCFIGHQIPICRDQIHSNLLISDALTLRGTFDKMLKIQPYGQEKSKFMSICDEWYRILEPQGLMNIEEKKMLREWIANRRYANTEDPGVSLVITKCLTSKIEKRKRNQEEVKKLRDVEMDQRKKKEAEEKEWENTKKKNRRSN